MLDHTFPRQPRNRRVGPAASSLLLLVVVGLNCCRGADFDHPPIEYTKATPDNCVTALQQRLDAGRARLAFDADHGWLKALLRELHVPLSSQVLVFSKTSLQRQRIGPKTPRAVYFNDDVYVGFCLRGDVLELSAADPGIGTAFYTLDQEPAARPRLTRQTENCLICHGSTLTRNT